MMQIIGVGIWPHLGHGNPTIAEIAIVELLRYLNDWNVSISKQLAGVRNPDRCHIFWRVSGILTIVMFSHSTNLWSEEITLLKYCSRASCGDITTTQPLWYHNSCEPDNFEPSNFEHDNLSCLVANTAMQKFYVSLKWSPAINELPHRSQWNLFALFKNGALQSIC